MVRILFLVASTVGLLRLVIPLATNSPRVALLILTPFLACVTLTSARAWSSYLTEAATPRASRSIVRRVTPAVRPAARRSRVLSPLDLCGAAAA